jgi:hypothetical protein
MGSILLILTLYKFIQSRRSLNGSSFNTDSRSYGITSTSGPHPNLAKKNQRSIDRSIIMRFSIAFTLLSVFDILNIIFQVRSLNAASTPTTATEPDFSAGSAIGDIVSFIPGVITALVAWAIWGTTKKHISTLKEFFGCCCSFSRRKSIESSTESGSGSTRKIRIGHPEERFSRLNSGVARNKSDIVVSTELRHETELRDMSREGRGSGSVTPEEWPRAYPSQNQVQISRA